MSIKDLNIKIKILKSYIKLKNLKNKIIDILVTEAKDNKELTKLIFKIAKERKITKKEKEQILEQLSDNAKLIMSAILFSLPAGSLIVPLIIKVADKLGIDYKTNKTFE